MGRTGPRKLAASPFGLLSGLCGGVLLGLAGADLLLKAVTGTGSSPLQAALFGHGAWSIALLAVPGALGLAALLHTALPRCRVRAFPCALVGVAASALLLGALCYHVAAGAAVPHP